MGPTDTNEVPPQLQAGAALLGKKWHSQIIWHLLTTDGLSFSELEEVLDGISSKVLSDALAELRERGVINRTELGHRPLRVRYTLTERGAQLGTIIESLASWGERYLATDDDRTVLIAESDSTTAQRYTSWLVGEYTIRLTTDGREALREIDVGVDVAVLHRNLPAVSGREVLSKIRADGHNCGVLMVFDQQPDGDLDDMAFDESRLGPVERDDFRETVADLIERVAAADDVRQYLALRAKITLLESAYPPDTLATDAQYAELTAQADALDIEPADIQAAGPRAFRGIQQYAPDSASPT
jgi:DNA-binding HxlR family transcriptional regulator/DNA-binding NarL/FixJ family response regulator